jgi:hypothetical protein
VRIIKCFKKEIEVVRKQETKSNEGKKGREEARKNKGRIQKKYNFVLCSEVRKKQTMGKIKIEGRCNLPPNDEERAK